MRTRGFELTEVSLTTRQRRMGIRRSAKLIAAVNEAKRNNPAGRALLSLTP